MNINTANKILQEKYPDILLVKGNGYFYIASDDKELGLKIAGLYSSSIYTNSLSDVTKEMLLSWVDELFNANPPYQDDSISF